MSPDKRPERDSVSMRGMLVMAGLSIGVIFGATELGIAIGHYSTEQVYAMRVRSLLIGVPAAMVFSYYGSQMGESVINGAARIIHKIRGFRNHHLNVS